MAQHKFEWAKYSKKGEREREIHIDDMDYDEYHTKYKGYLFCPIEGCPAHLKFTRRSDGGQFYSTNKNEGSLHSDDCVYGLSERGQVERDTIIEQEVAIPLSHERIIGTLKRKAKALKQLGSVTTPKEQVDTRNVVDTGNETMHPAYRDNGEIGEATEGRVRIGSVDSRLITPEFEGTRKCVYGKIANTYFNKEDRYGYVNLKNDHYNVSIYFPEAFYADGLANIRNLETFLKILNTEKSGGKDLIIICVGEIYRRKNNENLFNISIQNPRHLLINDETYIQIIGKNAVQEHEYRL